MFTDLVLFGMFLENVTTFCEILKNLNLVEFLSLHSSCFFFQISESFTRTVHADHEKFSCSFHLVYSPSTLDLRKTRAFCSPSIRDKVKRLYILAPSGYRFTVDMDINPTRFTAATVQGTELYII